MGQPQAYCPWVVRFVYGVPKLISPPNFTLNLLNYCLVPWYYKIPISSRSFILISASTTHSRCRPQEIVSYSWVGNNNRVINQLSLVSPFLFPSSSTAMPFKSSTAQSLCQHKFKANSPTFVPRKPQTTLHALSFFYSVRQLAFNFFQRPINVQTTNYSRFNSMACPISLN